MEVNLYFMNITIIIGLKEKCVGLLHEYGFSPASPKFGVTTPLSSKFMSILDKYLFILYKDSSPIVTHV